MNVLTNPGSPVTENPPALFETIVRAAADAIVYADAEGMIRFWNASAERLFGYGAAEAVGRSLDLIIPGCARAIGKASAR